MKKYLLIILIFLVQAAAFAQKKGQAKTDSLQQVLKTTRQDTTRIKTLNALASDLLQTGKIDSAIERASSALLLSRKINYSSGEARSFYTLGQIYAAKANTAEALKNFGNALKLYEVLSQETAIAETCYAMGLIYQRSNYEEALRLFKRALGLAQQTGNKNLMGKNAYIIAVVLTRKGDYNEASPYNDQAIRYYTESGNKTGLANCYVVSARINHRRGNMQQSLKDNYAALRLFEQTGNKVGIYNVHTGLGMIYLLQKNNLEALKSYQAAKKAAEEQGNKEVLSGAYNNVGNTYLELGNTAEAQKAFEEALKLAEQAADKKGIATARGNLGIIYSQTGKPAEAIKSYEQTIKLYEEIGAKEGISVGYMEIGRVYLKMKKSELSREWLNKALKISREIDYKDVISQSYHLLMQVDSSAHDYNSALEHYKLYISYRDSISNAEAAKNLIEQRMQYGFSKKEDSLRLQQALLSGRLEKQTLLTKQQQQELRLKQASLVLAQREKDVQMLRFLKTQAELQLGNEQKEKKLTLAEQQRALQQSQLEKQTLLAKQKEQSLLLKDKELSAQRSQRNFWLAGAIALFMLSFFIFRNYRNQRRANAQLQKQQAKTERALKELKATQTQLIQSEKMASLGELTAGIAHEIQNPLNFVNNFSELNNEMLDEMKHELQSGKLEDAVAVAEGIKENNSKINHHGKRADAIVKGMLQHSRASTRKKEPTDINTLADEYLHLSFHGLRAKDKDFHATFSSDFDDHVGKLEVVPQEIGMVVLNLCNNAFYAVNEKKKQLNGAFEPNVSVSTKKLADRVEISVRDNGTGIPQKALSKIYQPFFTTKPTGQGTGLGLSLSYDIVKAHGGELKVETKEGEFAEFIIRLPVESQVS